MFENLSNIYKFLLDGSKHIALRVSVPLLSILAIIVVNDLCGFSRSYFLNNKLNSLIEIQKMEPNVMQTDPIYKRTYESTKRDLLIDHSYLKKWYSAINSQSKAVKRPVEPNTENQLSYNNRIWLNISSMLLSYLICLMLIGVGIAALFNSKGGKQVWNTISSVILMMLISLALGRIFKEVVDFIVPIFMNQIWINVLINIFLQMIVITLLVMLISKMRKES